MKKNTLIDLLLKTLAERMIIDNPKTKNEFPKILWTTVRIISIIQKQTDIFLFCIGKNHGIVRILDTIIPKF